MIAEFRIGLIDWGIGGLSVYKQIRRQLKSISCVYLSDAGFHPYGKVPKDELIQRLHRLTNFFRQQNINTVVIACNAASTVINEVQKLNKDMHFFGMLEAGKNSILKSKRKSILVLGGKRTIESGYFQNQFKNPKIILQAEVAQPLSALIEKGQHRSQKFSNIVHQIAEATEKKPDLVLLACTHYPAATLVFKKHFSKAKIIDPAVLLAKELKKELPKKYSKKKSTFYTSGSIAQSKSSAKKAFQLSNIDFKKVKIE